MAKANNNVRLQLESREVITIPSFIGYANFWGTVNSSDVALLAGVPRRRDYFLIRLRQSLHAPSLCRPRTGGYKEVRFAKPSESLPKCFGRVPGLGASLQATRFVTICL